MSRKFQILRGNKANLPTLSDGEMAFCNDTKELYIGSGGTNRRIGDSETAYGVATGTNNYVVTVDKQLSTYTAGLMVNFLVQNVNTTATTLNVNGLGVKNIYKNVDEPVSAGSFRAGQIVSVVYDGINFQLLSQNLYEIDGSMIQNDTVSNAKLAADIKVGSLASLTTNNKSTVVDAVNELETNLNLVQSNKVDKQENNWITPVLENGWVNFGSGYAEAKYMKDNLGFVHLRGMVKSGNIVAPIFTLEVGFRPSATLNFVVASNGLAKYLRVFANGAIVSQSATNEWIDLSGISFWPDS